MRERPKRPARSLRDFARRCNYGVGSAEWPCLVCHGLGWEYDPADPPCPVTGNQHRRAIRCPVCQGSGAGSKKACQEAYRQALEEYRAKKREYERLGEIRKAALRRLTKEQIQALKELGL